MFQTHRLSHTENPQVVVLDRGDYTTCTMRLKGACLTSWKIQNEEQIFMSRLATMDAYKKIRGGISIVFPHFSKWKFGPKHGFVRNLLWQIESGPQLLSDGDVYLVIYLKSTEFTKAIWNYEFKLHYSIRLRATSLETKMMVFNTSPHFSFEFNLNQHVYFRAKDITKCTLSGLQDVWYKDRLVKISNESLKLQQNKDLKLDGPFDRIYIHSPNEIQLNNDEEKKVVKITRTGLPDLHVWNPYQSSIYEEDMDQDEAHNFITIDFGLVYSKRFLPANSYWTASESIEVIKKQEGKSKIQMLLENLDKICSI